jgi:hypothetical protein
MARAEEMMAKAFIETARVYLAANRREEAAIALRMAADMLDGGKTADAK